MKLLLVEDETESLAGMKRAVETIDLPFSLYTSNHADIAAKIIQNEWPDMIVTDIMLPGMTGLELIERYTGGGYHPKVIVVSGYNDFEYARRSIRFGAVDYILKPFITEEFIDKLTKSMLHIMIEQEQNQELKEQKAFADIGTQSMRDSYLLDLCYKRTSLEEHLYQRLRLWDLEWIANGSYGIMVMDTKGFPDGKPMKSKYALQTFAIGNIVQEVIRDYKPSILFKDLKNRWVLITDSQYLKQITKLIVDMVGQYHKIHLSVGVSAAKSNFEDIHSAYQESVKALRVQSLSGEVEIFDTEEPTLAWDQDTIMPVDFAAMICERDEKRLKKAVHQYIRQTVLIETVENRGDIVRNVMMYLSQVLVCIRECTSKEMEEIPMKMWEALDECKTLEEYESVITNYFLKLIRDVSPQHSNALIERAVQLITNRYMEELSLQLIADELCLHPVWLSQSFKKETGKTYMDFLTETRIDKAKSLLRESNLKIYDIAEAVGYHDLQHFGNIFKKRTGQTPKEYRYGK
ncbi:helix-turn-helix domain-containing protein [Candidatus Pristimantibacillus sp. PTI5]|uniref:helix-turn-helix domain-containing protein n=1 Tax=Candidatus Pristimantibacillus sp. PTI5 TaxID=3400422 RepID=UPI003B01ED3D